MLRGTSVLVGVIALVASIGMPIAAPSEPDSRPAESSRVPGSGFEFVATASLQEPRGGSSATLLPDGRVLIIGGHEVASAETWDPTTEQWRSAGQMAQPREGHSATLLSDGRVLVSGGGAGALDIADEVWEPTTDTFRAADEDGVLATRVPAAPMPVTPVPVDTALTADDSQRTLLANGWVLVTGGLRKTDPQCDGLCGLKPTDAAWLYDPTTGTVAALEPMTTPREGHTATLLPDGRVLIVGSHRHGPQDRTAELFQPSGG